MAPMNMKHDMLVVYFQNMSSKLNFTAWIWPENCTESLEDDISWTLEILCPRLIHAIVFRRIPHRKCQRSPLTPPPDFSSSNLGLKAYCICLMVCMQHTNRKNTLKNTPDLYSSKYMNENIFISIKLSFFYSGVQFPGLEACSVECTCYQDL